jgi:hypothetical protein
MSGLATNQALEVRSQCTYHLLSMALKRILVTICVCGLVGAVSGRSNSQTLVSPDGTFQLKYSSSLVACDRGGKVFGEWVPIPPCGDCGRKRDVVACFAYPEDAFKEKPEFGGANFQVQELDEVPSEDICLNGAERSEANQTPARDVKINGVAFKALDTGGLSGHDYVSAIIYRTYHAKVCYDLRTAMTDRNLQVMEVGPHKEYTKKDRTKVLASLNEALNTFKFLK